MDSHAAVPIPLTEHERMVIARSLDITATIQDALDWPSEAEGCRELRVKVLGDLKLEQAA